MLNHLEALDHCLMTHVQLRDGMEKPGLRKRLVIPDDGERLELQREPNATHVPSGQLALRKPGLRQNFTSKLADT